MFVKTIRRETGLIEHLCPHGVDHPAYASADWQARAWIDKDEDYDIEGNRDAWLIHGCDGCCNDESWQIQSLKDSVEIANQLILDHKDVIRKLREKLNNAG